MSLTTQCDTQHITHQLVLHLVPILNDAIRRFGIPNFIQKLRLCLEKAGVGRTVRWHGRMERLGVYGNDVE